MIDLWHKARGFKSPSGKHIGYHYFIRRDGFLEGGRGVEEVGAHAEGKNADSIGICLAGLTSFSANQFSTLTAVLQTLKQVFPDATVHAHNEFSSKACPVFDVAPFKALYET
jgi:N-acetyl-anhydromuramyl-L-alanine amidase AmpD